MARVVVNGSEREVDLGVGGSLLDVVRDGLGLTGAKPGCGEGACGACTVLLDGVPVRACVTTPGEAAGRALTTVEGIAADGALHPVQDAFVLEGAVQCGYCTPGFVVAAAALLARNREPSPEEIRAALSGNVCRCCAYVRIERAVQRAATVLRGETPEPPVATDEPPVAATFWEFRPRAPWHLVAPAQREWFDLLGDGLVVVLPPSEDVGWAASAGAWLHLSPDGVVTVFTGKVDIGQDNRTALSCIVAEELGVPPASVRLAMGDTDLCPPDRGTFGSRSLPGAGEDLRTLAAAARGLLEQGEVHAGAWCVETAARETEAALPATWTRVGRPALRATARERVTGAHVFPSDVSRPGLLHGRILWPPTYGAVLRSAELDAARALPGVVAVAEDGVVAVGAPDREAAARALSLVEAEWEEHAHPSEADLVDHLRSHPLALAGWEQPLETEDGDVENALASADVRLEATYTTAFLAHVSPETRVALAEWEDGRLTVWTGTQQPFEVRSLLAEALGISEADVRVLVPDTGGGFGSKHTEQVALAAARLARSAGRPVRIALTREEEFRHSYLRPAAVIDMRSGGQGDGTIVALEQRTLNAGSAALTAPYAIANRLVASQPTASPLPQGPYRSLGAIANTFARESHLDELAHALGVGPLELRLRHLDDPRLATVLEAAVERIGWGAPLSAGEGMGIAVGFEKHGRVATCVRVRVDGGEVEIVAVVTAYDCGAIVNPDNVRRQIESGTVMALGGALFEAVHFHGGRLLNASLSAYRVPRFSDVPPIEVVLLDRPDLPSAGAGETPLIAVAPAIANAIFAASGTRKRSLPLLPL